MENMHTDFKVQRVNSESALFVTSVSPPAGKQDSPQLSRGRVEEKRVQREPSRALSYGSRVVDR